MSDETSEGQVPDTELTEEVHPVENTETPADEEASDTGAESEEAAREVGAGNAGESPQRPAGQTGGLPRTTTTGDPELDLRKPGAGAVDQGDALDRERSGDDVRGHPEDHGTLLPD